MSSCRRIKPPLCNEFRHEVWDRVARGMGNKEIAFELGISANTVRKHIACMLHSSGMHNRTQLALEWWGDAWRKEMG